MSELSKGSKNFLGDAVMTFCLLGLRIKRIKTNVVSFYLFYNYNKTNTISFFVSNTKLIKTNKMLLLSTKTKQMSLFFLRTCNTNTAMIIRLMTSHNYLFADKQWLSVQWQAKIICSLTSNDYMSANKQWLPTCWQAMITFQLTSDDYLSAENQSLPVCWQAMIICPLTSNDYPSDDK